jgi:DNA recombination protein RmuC
VVWIAVGLSVVVLALLGLMWMRSQQWSMSMRLARELGDQLAKFRQEMHSAIAESSTHQSERMITHLTQLSQTVYGQLKDIGGLVERRLGEGFEKTHQTFQQIAQRLAIIDEAQKRIAELSGHVISLQSLLSDKRSRGAFGEVQLAQLLENTLPQNAYALQATLSNGKRADCLLKLPGALGHLVIDAKFPLENYQRMLSFDLGSLDRKAAETQFSRDIQTHLDDIATKYICPPDTSDSAVMFIPAEAVFAEIHAHHPTLVQRSHQKRVWMVSPSTLMAVLTTANAVIRDEQTRAQIHIIQEHLLALGTDFERFQKRMSDLERHISQANEDVQSVNISAKKISSRFTKIQKVQLDPLTKETLEPTQEDHDES